MDSSIVIEQDTKGDRNCDFNYRFTMYRVILLCLISLFLSFWRVRCFEGKLSRSAEHRVGGGPPLVSLGSAVPLASLTVISSFDPEV